MPPAGGRFFSFNVGLVGYWQRIYNVVYYMNLTSITILFRTLVGRFLTLLYHMKKILITLLFLGVLASNTQAQNSFSFDLIQFANDLEDFIDKSGSRTAKDAAGEFVANYNAGKFSNNQKMQVIKMCNQMLYQHFLVSPHFEDYLNAMNGMVVNNQVDKFDNWHKVLNQSYAKGKDEFAAFIKVSRNIFYDKVVLITGSMKWMTTNVNVDFIAKGEPAFIFKGTDLFGYTPGDTLEIYQTTGRFEPATNTWYGKKGRTDWTRVGIDSTKMYSELRNYKLTLEDGTLTADSALFHYPELLSQPLLGKLVDKAMSKSLGDKSVYPQFDSYKKNFTQLSFGKGKYSGGFGMKGDEIIGSGSDTSNAELTFYFKNKPVLKVAAREMIVRKSKVSTKKAAAILFLDKDSIYHPQLEFTYRIPENTISLYRGSEGISSAPFYDTYHNVEFYCDELKWDLDNPSIDVDMLNDNEPARFESVNYFRDVRYERVQGILGYNPLQRIKIYCEKRNINGFFIEDYAAAYKSGVSDIRIQMIELHDKGYVFFNEKKDYVTVKRKLKDYVNAHFGNTDYDAITFQSVIKRYPNASISLINNDLQIQGVPKFYFSDSQNVYIIPRNQVVTLKKNRSMDFSGKLRAGKADFYGNGFVFDYTTFQVRLNNIDSLKFLYHDDAQGVDLPIKSALQNIYGTLAIDHPYNKSGRKKYPGYPIFKSDVGSKVFYNQPETQKGVYDPNRFYFDVEPFTMDSLNELDLEKMSLGGTLVSGGIIPDLKYALSLQPDKSLGFVLDRTEAGYPMYGGKGRGFIKLSLSNEGFFGNGELKYLASTSTSDKFIMLLDSMNAQCNTFLNKRTEIYPEVTAANVYEHWLPYADTMFVTRTAELISFSEKRAALDGTLIYTPGSMHARGNINVEQAQLGSMDFWLQPDQFLADEAYFRLFDLNDSTKFAFTSGSVKARVDLANRLGDFKFNTKGINSNFVYNLYAGSFDEFLWRMDPKTIDFKSAVESEKPETYLISVRKSQDSLMFNTGLTTLRLSDYTIESKKIPYIAVGDAHVFADSGKVIVRANAEMDQLERAKILADTVNKYHSIDSVTLKIAGKYEVYGTGSYEYIDRKKNKQKFFLNEIRINPAHNLVAKSFIPDSTKFYVGTKIQFRGNAVLTSIVRNLEYDGYFLPIHELPIPKTDWFKNAAVVNPDSVYIKVQTPSKNMNQQTLMTGFNISNDSAHVYPAFFSRKRNTSDPEMLRVEGVLYYDEKNQEFRMGNQDKLFKDAPRGNMFVLNESKKLMYGEGRFKLGFEGSKFEITSGGNAEFSLVDTSFIL